MTRLEAASLIVLFIVFLAAWSFLIWVGGLSMRAECAATYQHHFATDTYDND